MSGKVNTIDVGEQQQYLSASSYWQYSEFESPTALRFREDYGLFRQPYLKMFIVSADIYLPSPDIANETVSTSLDVICVSPRIIYRNPEAVKVYLACHPEIEDFIDAAWPMLVECFEDSIDIVLEVITYPDESAHQELVGWIQSSDDVNQGLDKLERFEDEWFLDHMAEVDNKFNFNIETR